MKLTSIIVVCAVIYLTAAGLAAGWLEKRMPGPICEDTRPALVFMACREEADRVRDARIWAALFWPLALPVMLAKDAVAGHVE